MSKNLLKILLSSRREYNRAQKLSGGVAGADLEHNLGGGGPRACKRYWPSQRGKVAPSPCEARKL